MPSGAMGLNPNGLLSQLFGLDVRRPPKPSWDPRRSHLSGDIGPDLASSMWAYYQDKMTISQERLDAYRDYDEMDFDDLIASVLDAIAEDSTQSDFMNGKSIWFETDNKELQVVLNKMAVRLKMEEVTPQLVREISKFGDDFEYLHANRNEGIVALEHYMPSSVWKQEKEGRLMGYSLDPNNNDRSKLFLPWEFQHFMRPAGRRLLGVQYGDAWIRPARRLYRKVQMTEDAIIMYRLKRAPDRDVYYIDVGDSPIDESISILRQWRRILKKNTFIDTATNKLKSDMNPLAPDEDIFWPTREGNNSRIDRLSGSSNVGEVWDYKLLIERLFSTLRAPKEYFGFGEGGGFNADKSISQLDIRWARGCKTSQKGVTTGWTKIAMVHMALLGINPLDKKNQFRTCMAPISYLDELQRADLYDVRTRCINSLNGITEQLNLNRTKWFQWLLYKFGGFSIEFLDKFKSSAKSDQNTMPNNNDDSETSGDDGLDGRDLTNNEKESLLEMIGPEIPMLITDICRSSTSSDEIYELMPNPSQDVNFTHLEEDRELIEEYLNDIERTNGESDA